MDMSCLSIIGSQTLCVVLDCVCSMGSHWKNLEGAVRPPHHSMLLQLLTHSALVSLPTIQTKRRCRTCLWRCRYMKVAVHLALESVVSDTVRAACHTCSQH